MEVYELEEVSDAQPFYASSYIILPLSVVLLYLTFKLLWRPRLPPGPCPWPIVGNLPSIAPVRFRCFMEWAERYGPIVSVWMGSNLNVVVSNAELAREVLKDKDQAVASRQLTRAAARFSRNGQDLIWADYGPHYVVKDMITAGMDTTAISAEWAMAELIRNPRVQKKAQEEIDRVIGQDRVVSETDFHDLPYLQCVAKEALRLHPPTPLMLPHKASEDVKIGGYDIPRGTTVHVNVYAIARDPSIWKDPLTFKPERFLEEDIDIKGHDYRLLPFGAGRRVCPGAQLGLNMVELMLARLLHHFSWAPPPGVDPHEIDMTERPGVVTFMAKPLEALATPRLPENLYQNIKFIPE